MNDEILLVAAGFAAWLILSKQAKTTAAARTRTGAVAGPSVVDGLGKWLGSSSGQANIGRAATAVGGWFKPSTAATPPMDWGTGPGWGDDSTSGAVVDSAQAFDSVDAGVWD